MNEKLVKRNFIRNFSKSRILLSMGMIMILMLSATLYSRAENAPGLQKKVVTGTVIAASDNLPIIGASIIIEGTTTGTVTNIDGEFRLEADAADVLLVSFIGYKKFKVTVGNQTTFSITLKESMTDLDEVVVVGYGVQKKKLLTGSTIQVDGESLQKLSTTSVLGALQSQSPGVKITQNSGQPGEGFKVYIRGLGTTGDASPLYVIDGVAGGSISSLNPSDIESIDVLKDAASAAIYGARAANGVILVTTKQGKKGKIQLSYDGYYGFQNAYKMAPLLNATEYMNIIDEIKFNEGLDLYDWSTKIPDIYEKVQNGWEGTNWLKEIHNADAPIQNHAFNMTGGSDVSNFSMGFSYSAQEGIFGSPVEPNYDRYTARINSDHVVHKSSKGFDVVKIGETLNFNYAEKSGIGIGNLYWNDIHNMLNACPLLPVYDDDGEYTATDYLSDSGLASISTSYSNPIASMVYQRGQNTSKSYALNVNTYVEIQPIKSLIIKSSFGYKMSASDYRSYVPEYDLNSTTTNTSDDITQSQSVGHSWTWENTASYSFKINQHSITALVGQSLEKWGMGTSLSVTDDYSIFDDFDHAYISNAQGLSEDSGGTSISGSPWDDGGISSFFGRVLYNYKETYMASVVMRADGSSNFASGNRWGYFPSVSAGWVMSNESFMQPTQNWLDFFKLRASWGQNGNCNIDNFQYLATIAFDDSNNYSFGNSKTSQSTGAYPDILPNEDITWETSEQLDIGFDARVLDSRLGIAFDWYNKTTKDWLVEAPILASYGTNAPYINGGDVENKGIELALNWNDNIGDFTYGINVNFAKNKNEVTRIANSEGIIHGESNVLSQGTDEMYRAEVGKSIGYFWGFKTAGVFQNQEEANAAEATLQDDPQAGDLIFVDMNGDGSITDDDKTEIGNPHPDYTLGFAFNVGYKGFDFSVTTNGAFGQQIAKSYRSFADSYQANYTTEIFGRWHGEGTSNKLPRLTAGSNTNWQEISDIYIEDGDYLKIQNVTIGYDFKTLFTNIPLSQIRLYVTAQNLYTFTNYSGMDPEIGYGYGESWVSGIDLGFYPSPRTFLIGVNLKF
jgi:TonB-linked SusC/RagA family outer membrane protein